jgi:hypothetical protein
MQCCGLEQAYKPGEDVPWWDRPVTWPLWGRLLFGGALAFGVGTIIHYASKTQAQKEAARFSRRTTRPRYG